MSIARRWPLPIVLVLGGVAAFVVSLALHAGFPAWRAHQTALHSTIEALGGLCAIMMAVVLFQRSADRPNRYTEAPAMGFLAMGILEEFHAVSSPGHGFIFLRSLASFAGSVGFLLVWLPESPGPRSLPRLIPWSIAVVCTTIGLSLLTFPGMVPVMIRNGEFSPTAVAPTSLACVFFLAAAWRLVAVYRRAPSADPYFFACLALIFGLAELMFMYSRLWDAPWWFWHFLRLSAYLLVLGYIVAGYLNMVSDLKVSLASTREAEESSRRSEQHLRRLLEDRERMAQNLHDGIIQSLFALGLGLERCRRLLSTDQKEVARQLDVSIPALNAVIRELRRYLIGVEPEITSGRELEAALAVEASTLNNSQDLRIAVQIDPRAADIVTPEQATHLLYIAREALSNSLRHAKARHATVVLERQDGRVRFVVEDDGVGFDVRTSTAGEGLKNMAARSAKLHAELHILSEPGRGTRVVFELPEETVHV